MADVLNQRERIGAAVQRLVLSSIACLRRALGLNRSRTNFDAMSPDELEQWRENFQHRVNIRCAWSNYLRSEEGRAIERRYDQVVSWFFYPTLATLPVLLFVLGFDPRNTGTSLFMIGMVTLLIFPVARFARRRHPHRSLDYIVENYWPTNDDDPRTDASALPPPKETVLDRLAQAIYVDFWPLMILQGLFILVFMLQRV